VSHVTDHVHPAKLNKTTGRLVPPGGINCMIHAMCFLLTAVCCNELERQRQKPSSPIPKHYTLTSLAQRRPKTTFSSTMFRARPHQLAIVRFSCPGTDLVGSQNATGFQQLDLP
jgi:hypothetical protein